VVLSLVYLLVGRRFALIVLRRGGEAFKDVERLVLQHPPTASVPGTTPPEAVISSETKVFCFVARRAPMLAFVTLLLDHHHRIEQRVRSRRGTGFWKVYPDRVDFKF
jgi:hypothetical protein